MSDGLTIDKPTARDMQRTMAIVLDQREVDLERPKQRQPIAEVIRAVLLEEITDDEAEEGKRGVQLRRQSEIGLRVSFHETVEGTVVFTINATDTAAIAIDASESAIVAALEGHTDINAGDVVVTAAPGRWWIRFSGTVIAADVTVDDDGLTSGLSTTRQTRWFPDDEELEFLIVNVIPLEQPGAPPRICAGNIVRCSKSTSSEEWIIDSAECREFDFGETATGFDIGEPGFEEEEGPPI